MRWGLILLLLSASAHALDFADWVSRLDATRANLLTEARVNVAVGEPAEDTELEFSLACAEISAPGEAVTLGYFKDLGDKFQVCIDVNANTVTGSSEVRSCWKFLRSEIEK